MYTCSASVVNLGWPVRHCWSALLKRVFGIEFATAAASKAEEEREKEEGGGGRETRRKSVRFWPERVYVRLKCLT